MNPEIKAQTVCWFLRGLSDKACVGNWPFNWPNTK